MADDQIENEENAARNREIVLPGNIWFWFFLPEEVKGVVIDNLDIIERRHFRNSCFSIRQSVEHHKLKPWTRVFVDFEKGVLDYDDKDIKFNDDFIAFTMFMSFYYAEVLHVINTPVYLDDMITAMDLNTSVSVKELTMQFGDVQMVEMFLHNNEKIKLVVLVGEGGLISGIPDSWIEDVLKSPILIRVPQLAIKQISKSVYFYLLLENWIVNDAPIGSEALAELDDMFYYFEDNGFSWMMESRFYNRMTIQFPYCVIRTDNPKKEILVFYSSYKLYLTVAPAGTREVEKKAIEDLSFGIIRGDVDGDRFSRMASSLREQVAAEWEDDYNAGNDDLWVDEEDNWDDEDDGVELPELEDHEL